MIKNNSWAMIATVALVGSLASMIGFFNSKNCVAAQAEGWTSCSAISEQQGFLFWGLLAVSAFGFGVSIARRVKKKDR